MKLQHSPSHKHGAIYLCSSLISVPIRTRTIGRTRFNYTKNANALSDGEYPYMCKGRNEWWLARRTAQFCRRCGRVVWNVDKAMLTYHNSLALVCRTYIYLYTFVVAGTLVSCACVYRLAFSQSLPLRPLLRADLVMLSQLGPARPQGQIYLANNTSP